MKRPPKSSLEDVAQAAKVSIATASRVLNNTAPVRPETKDRVLRAVARLRYTPDLQARTLRGGKSWTIGMIVSNLKNPFFLDVYESLEAEAHRLGHEVLVASTGYDLEQLMASIRLMHGRRVSGIAAIVSEMAPLALAELMATDIPVFVQDAEREKHGPMTIQVDYVTGMRQIVDLLHGLGHRRFAFVGHHTTLTSLSVRERAFADAMTRLGRVSYQIVTETDSLDGGRRAAHVLSDSAVPPTAIVCVNDFIAAGVIRGLRDRGIRVPQDVSVTGFDNVTLAEYTEPTLTTVDIPRDEIGRVAVQALLQPNAKEHKSKNSRPGTITTTLVVRESTAVAPRVAPRKPKK